MHFASNLPIFYFLSKQKEVILIIDHIQQLLDFFINFGTIISSAVSARKKTIKTLFIFRQTHTHT